MSGDALLLSVRSGPGFMNSSIISEQCNIKRGVRGGWGGGRMVLD